MIGSAKVDVCALPVLTGLQLFQSDSDYLWDSDSDYLWGNMAVYGYV